MDAFKTAFNELCERYTAVVGSEPEFEECQPYSAPRLLPYPLRGASSVVQLKLHYGWLYKCVLPDAQPAQAGGEETAAAAAAGGGLSTSLPAVGVMVKYARPEYGAAVHRAWAEAGVAPQLRSAELLPGGILQASVVAPKCVYCVLKPLDGTPRRRLMAGAAGVEPGDVFDHLMWLSHTAQPS